MKVSRPGTARNPDLRATPVTLDREGPEPLYLQIKSWMSDQIRHGRWPLHYKLPAEENLARSLGVNRGTLRQALQSLISERRIKRIHGRGTFVISETQVEGRLTGRLVAFSEDLLLQGIQFRTEVIQQRVAAPNARIRGLLDVAPDGLVLVLKRRRFVDGLPIILTMNYVRINCCPGIEKEDFENQALFGYLENRHHLHLAWARRTTGASGAPRDVAQFLKVPENSPLLYMEQIAYLEDGQPIECSDIWLRSDRFKLSSIISREVAQPKAMASAKTVHRGRPRHLKDHGSIHFLGQA